MPPVGRKPGEKPAEQQPAAEPVPDELAQPLPDDATPEERLERAELHASAAYAQVKAIGESAGEILGDLSKRVADLEQAAGAPADSDAPVGVEDLARRLAKLEQHVTVPLEVKVVPARSLCDECGGLEEGPHFDHCSHYNAPRERVGEAA